MRFEAIRKAAEVLEEHKLLRKELKAVPQAAR